MYYRTRRPAYTGQLGPRLSVDTGGNLTCLRRPLVVGTRRRALGSLFSFVASHTRPYRAERIPFETQVAGVCDPFWEGFYYVVLSNAYSRIIRRKNETPHPSVRMRLPPNILGVANSSETFVFCVKTRTVGSPFVKRPKVVLRTDRDPPKGGPCSALGVGLSACLR